MKKKVLFATMVALTCALTSCLKDDDLEMLRHPIHVTGEFDPTLGIPVGSGQMNMNDLLTSLSGSWGGAIIDTGDVITVEYSMSTSDTVKASSYMQGKKAMPKKSMNMFSTPSPKVNWYVKDTVLQDTIDIDFFDDVEFLDSISLAHVWVDLSVGVHGDVSDIIADKVNVTFDSMEIWYKDHTNSFRQFIDPTLDTFHVYIPDLRDTVKMAFPTMDMADMVNDRPSKMVARYHLKLRVDPSIVSQNIATMSVQDIIDSIGMSYLVYSAKMDVKMPLSVSINNMVYNFDVDMGDGLSSVNLDSILNSIHEGISAEITDCKFKLSLDNGIPLNLSLSARGVAADSVTTLCTIFLNEKVPAAEIGPMANDPLVYEAKNPTHKVIETQLSKTDIEKLKESKYLRVNVTVDSRDDNNMLRHVTVKRSDYLKLKAYLQVHPTVDIDVQIH